MDNVLDDEDMDEDMDNVLDDEDMDEDMDERVDGALKNEWGDSAISDCPSVAKGVKVGDRFPNVLVQVACTTEKKTRTSTLLADKKVIVIGLPHIGIPLAYAPMIQSYVDREAELHQKGISKVLVYAVADRSAMELVARQWNDTTQTLNFVTDFDGELTEALDLWLRLPLHPGPRCRRFAMIVDDGVIKAFTRVSLANDIWDELAYADAMLEKL